MHFHHLAGEGGEFKVHKKKREWRLESPNLKPHVAHPVAPSSIKQMLGEGNFFGSWFIHYKLLLAFSHPECRAHIWRSVTCFHLIPPTSVPVFQPFQVISGPPPDPHQSHFVRLSSAVAEACGNKAPLWSDGICPFNNPGVIATHQSVKGLHNWVNECVVRNLILYSLWGWRSQFVTTDRDDEREWEREMD